MAETDSNRFPFINLEKSVERARQMYEGDPAGRPMRVVDAFELWGYSPKSSGGFQTVSALKMYGLIADIGANEDRKVQLTEAARRYFMDEREDQRAKLVQEFARSPRFINTVWHAWKARPPADNIARSQLKLDWKLNEQSARSFLGIYKENLAYAALSDGDTVTPAETVRREEPLDSPEERPEDPPPPDRTVKREIAVQANERVVFSEEAGQAQYLKLVASGDMDDALLEALESYVQRQRARLKPKAAQPSVAANDKEDLY